MVSQDALQSMQQTAQSLKNLLESHDMLYAREELVCVRADGYLLAAAMFGYTAEIVDMQVLDFAGLPHFLVKAKAVSGAQENIGYALCGPTDPGHEEGIHARALALAQTRALARALRPLIAPYLVLAGLSATIAEELPALSYLNQFAHRHKPSGTPQQAGQAGRAQQPQRAGRTQQSQAAAEEPRMTLTQSAYEKLSTLPAEKRQRAISAVQSYRRGHSRHDYYTLLTRIANALDADTAFDIAIENTTDNA